MNDETQEVLDKLFVIATPETLRSLARDIALRAADRDETHHALAVELLVYLRDIAKRRFIGLYSD